MRNGENREDRWISPRDPRAVAKANRALIAANRRNYRMLTQALFHRAQLRGAQVPCYGERNPQKEREKEKERNGTMKGVHPLRSWYDRNEWKSNKTNLNCLTLLFDWTKVVRGITIYYEPPIF